MFYRQTLSTCECNLLQVFVRYESFDVDLGVLPDELGVLGLFPGSARGVAEVVRGRG